ncbi:hypothetical protein HYY75_07980 [bacterium]|nr:hypothetical protein [bacterium]
MGASLAKSDHQNAKLSFQGILKTWVSFDNSYRNTPSLLGSKDPSYFCLFRAISSQLGNIQAMLEKDFFRDTHDQLENLITVIDRLSATSSPRKGVKEILNAQICLNSLSAGYMQNNAQSMLKEIDSLESALKILSVSIASASLPCLNGITKTVKDLRTAINQSNPPSVRGVDVAPIYTKLKNYFSEFKSIAFKNDWLIK